MAADLPTDELGGSFFDYDNDTDLDLFMANQLFQNVTHLPKEPIDETHQLKLDRPLGEGLNF